MARYLLLFEPCIKRGARFGFFSRSKATDSGTPGAADSNCEPIVLMVKNKCFTFEQSTDVSSAMILNIAERDLNGNKKSQLFLGCDEASTLRQSLSRISRELLTDLGSCTYHKNNDLIYRATDGPFEFRIFENIFGRFAEVTHNNAVFGKCNPIVLPAEDVPAFNSSISDSMSDILHIDPQLTDCHSSDSMIEKFFEMAKGIAPSQTLKISERCHIQHFKTNKSFIFLNPDNPEERIFLPSGLIQNFCELIKISMENLKNLVSTDDCMDSTTNDTFVESVSDFEHLFTGVLYENLKLLKIIQFFKGIRVGHLNLEIEHCSRIVGYMENTKDSRNN